MDSPGEVNAFERCRDEAMVRLTRGGEQAARAYIDSLSDPDYRDAARVQIAKFLTSARDVDAALQFATEVENQEEEIDVLLEIVRILNSHHQLNRAYRVLQTIETKSEKLSDHADFVFLVAVELERLGLKSDAIETLKRAMALSARIPDYKHMASAALWLARWGVEGEPEKAIESLPDARSRKHYMDRLREIREFAGRLNHVDS